MDSGEICLIRSQNVLNIEFSKSGLVFIDDEAADKLSNVVIEEDDVLLNITGDSVARCCLVIPDLLPARVNQHVAIIRPKKDVLDPKYLMYFLVSAPMQNYMLGLAASGGTRNALTKGMIEDFDIPLLNLNQQKAIAHILGTLDEKIELNRQMNATLESMAQALFKSWFVDFDPVIDNALAAGNPIPEPFQDRATTRKCLDDKAKPLPEAISNQFPDSFVFNEELGWVPEGWEVTSLLGIADKISKGTTPRKSDLTNCEPIHDVPFIKVKDITDDGQIMADGLESIPRSVHEGVLKRSMLKGGDVLFSIAGTIGRCSILPEELDDSNTNQAVAFVRPKSPDLAPIILYFLKSNGVQELVKSRIVQAVQANFSLTELGSLTLAIPNGQTTKHLAEIFLPKLNRISSLLSQNRHLTSLRNTLLPKLLSGELRIPDAEALAASAT